MLSVFCCRALRFSNEQINALKEESLKEEYWSTLMLPTPRRFVSSTPQL